MTKTVVIDGKEVKLTADARLPILFRAEFPDRNFFEAIDKLTIGDIDAAVLTDFAYLMAKAADPSIESEAKWLEGFDDPLAMLRREGPAVDVVTLITGTARSERGSVSPKKTGAEAAESR